MTDSFSGRRLKEFNQPTDGFPVRVRRLDGEEHCLPDRMRANYNSFRTTVPDGMNNVILPPPNRTVDHRVCENFDHGHHR